VSTRPVAPVTPDALRLREALARSSPLAALQLRLRESNDRFEVIRSSLPPTLAAHVRPGPLDAEGWSLLAANPAVAAKLRQLQPRLDAVLADGGWPALALRIKVRPA
jgi:hypothetical protein